MYTPKKLDGVKMRVPVNLALIVIGAWLLWTMLHLALARWGFEVDMAVLGQWGDSFGALNAAFSAAAVIGVIATLRLQSTEIATQQREIERQNERLVRADRNGRLQQFEATFFQLFALFRELRDKVKFGVNDDGDPLYGREAFEVAFNEMKSFLAKHALYSNEPEPEMGEVIERFYRDDIHRRSEGSLGPYFRVLYTVLRRVSENDDLSDDEKARYGNLVRSQMSSAEISLTAANALTKDSGNFRVFVEEFRLLKYLPKGTLYRIWLEGIYPAKTFEARD
ncbi:putative phage abortive infection protein [Shinella fusca]|uniref:Phage abortive infection protein n=1 Tax=Shinella fusca TaxID=544480 RepID=A0A7W8DTY3_9HYPH|nr:putative phage abortive infection protein [Shinella fusca]MBB5041885.1 hypothetical protein [Shinella fusca]